MENKTENITAGSDLASTIGVTAGPIFPGLTQLLRSQGLSYEVEQSQPVSGLQPVGQFLKASKSRSYTRQTTTSIRSQEPKPRVPRSDNQAPVKEPPPCLTFEEALAKWNTSDYKDKKMGLIDLSDLLFNPNGKKEVPQNVRRVKGGPCLHSIFRETQENSKYIFWRNLPEEDRIRWSSKAFLLYSWQGEQEKMGLIKRRCVWEITK